MFSYKVLENDFKSYLGVDLNRLSLLDLYYHCFSGVRLLMTSGAAKYSSKFSILRTGCIGMISHYNESQSQQHTTWLGFVQRKLQAASAKCFI